MLTVKCYSKDDLKPLAAQNYFFGCVPIDFILKGKVHGRSFVLPI